MLSRRLKARPAIRRTVPYAEWKPDLPAYLNPAATVASGVIPLIESYGPAKDLTVIYDALTATALGVIAARDISNNVFIYAGDVSKLYEGIDNTFTDQSGATYAVGSDDVWEFVVDDIKGKVIATNFADEVQSIEIGKGSSANFANHFTSTDTPKAKHIAMIRDFLVLGNYTESGTGHVPHGLWWSAIRNSVDMDASATTQADREDLDTGGWVQKVIGGAEYGVIFQNDLIRRMEYKGSPLVFEFPPVDRRRGTHVPQSVIGHGRNIFYWSPEGVFKFTGTQSIAIGEGKVDKTLASEFDPADKRNVSAAIDPLNKIVAWAFPGAGSTGGLPNKIWFYHWDTGWWSEAEIDTQIIAQVATQGYTLEGLDSVGTDIDNTTVFSESFDSDVWKGGQVRFAAFNTANRLSYFTGANLAATIETGDQELNPGGSTRVRKMRSLVDGGTLTGAVAGRDTLQSTVTYGSASSADRIGENSINDNSRYQRFRTSVAAGGTWSHAQGVTIIGSASRRR